jgi:hypothetical protein
VGYVRVVVEEGGGFKLECAPSVETLRFSSLKFMAGKKIN